MKTIKIHLPDQILFPEQSMHVKYVKSMFRKLESEI